MDQVILLLDELDTLGKRNGKIRKLKLAIIQATDLRNKGIVKIGGRVLTWHPNMKTKMWPEGMMLIYTEESYSRARDFLSTSGS